MPLAPLDLPPSVPRSRSLPSCDLPRVVDGGGETGGTSQRAQIAQGASAIKKRALLARIQRSDLPDDLAGGVDAKGQAVLMALKRAEVIPLPRRKKHRMRDRAAPLLWLHIGPADDLAGGVDAGGIMGVPVERSEGQEAVGRRRTENGLLNLGLALALYRCDPGFRGDRSAFCCSDAPGHRAQQAEEQEERQKEARAPGRAVRGGTHHQQTLLHGEVACRNTQRDQGAFPPVAGGNFEQHLPVLEGRGCRDPQRGGIAGGLPRHAPFPAGTPDERKEEEEGLPKQRNERQPEVVPADMSHLVSQRHAPLLLRERLHEERRKDDHGPEVAYQKGRPDPFRSDDTRRTAQPKARRHQSGFLGKFRLLQGNGLAQHAPQSPNLPRDPAQMPAEADQPDRPEMGERQQRAEGGVGRVGTRVVKIGYIGRESREGGLCGRSAEPDMGVGAGRDTADRAAGFSSGLTTGLAAAGAFVLTRTVALEARPGRKERGVPAVGRGSGATARGGMDSQGSGSEAVQSSARGSLRQASHQRP